MVRKNSRRARTCGWNCGSGDGREGVFHRFEDGGFGYSGLGRSLVLLFHADGAELIRQVEQECEAAFGGCLVGVTGFPGQFGAIGFRGKIELNTLDWKAGA